MTMVAAQAPIRRRSRALAAFAALLAGLAVLGTTLAEAGRLRALGKTDNTPDPTCPAPADPRPEQECQALGHVTGFQVKADGEKALFRMPTDGRLLAWRVDLSRPDRGERAFFEENLGDEELGDGPTGRISVLKRVGRAKYKLSKKTPTVDLSPYLGQRPLFTLNDPLKVSRGRIIALTTQTWIPNFAVAGTSENDTWRASRRDDRCSGLENLTDRSKPHERIGDERKYGCAYTGARLLYWVYYVRVSDGDGGGS
jgi:hypothetical protein